jgi:hypothetical protein
MPSKNSYQVRPAENEKIEAFANELILLLATIAFKDVPQGEAIDSLTRRGFSPKRIAELLGTTGNSVRVRRSKKKKQKKPQRNGNND